MFLTSNSFHKRRFNFQLLADAIAPSNIKAAVNLKTSVANEDIYCLSSMRENAWILLFCIATSSISCYSYVMKPSITPVTLKRE